VCNYLIIREKEMKHTNYKSARVRNTLNLIVVAQTRMQILPQIFQDNRLVGAKGTDVSNNLKMQYSPAGRIEHKYLQSTSQSGTMPNTRTANNIFKNKLFLYGIFYYFCNVVQKNINGTSCFLPNKSIYRINR
jgi:hypothetical protein